MHKRDGPVFARTVCISNVQDKPNNFFLASGFEVTDEKKREVMEGIFETIAIFGYFDKVPYIEAVLICQLADVDESIEKLKDFIRVIN